MAAIDFRVLERDGHPAVEFNGLNRGKSLENVGNFELYTDIFLGKPGYDRKMSVY